jgi:glycosyltransferase 2 family protein
MTTEVNQEEQKLRRSMSWKRILIPVLLGITAATWILVRNLNTHSYIEARENDPGQRYVWTDANGNGLMERTLDADFTAQPDGEYVRHTSLEMLLNVRWDIYATLALMGALVTMILRDFGYMYRIRVLTDKQLSWKQSFEVIMLWEFASAMTPSVVGGSGIAMFILHREGINMGKSTAITFVTAMLDEVFYIVTIPIVLVLIGTASLFPETWAGEAFGTNSVKILFWVGYFFIVLLTLLITLSIFLFPGLFKRVLQVITSIRILKRFRKRATAVGNEIITTSQELRGKPFMYWFKSFTATVLSWGARFLTLNFILLIFAPNFYDADLFHHLEVAGRQLVMWVIMLISPTPGGSGIAELALAKFFDYLMPVGMLALVAIIWRMLTYFPYLFAGAIILPRFLRRTASQES